MIHLGRMLRYGSPLGYQTVALRETEQPQVSLQLHTRQGTVDISDLHIPVSLRPFLLAFSLRQPEICGVLSSGSPSPLRLNVFDLSRPDLSLGEIFLEEVGSLQLGPCRFGLYRPKTSRTFCVPCWHRYVRYALAWWHTQRAVQREGNFQMTAPDLRSLDVYYIHPRPVYLVSVTAGEKGNIFPMDLVGYVDQRAAFVLALRSTSPSVETIRQTRSVALSSLPASCKVTIYALGVHHKQPFIDWAQVPFALIPSPQLQLPVPAVAFRVREYQVEAYQEIGSHTVFLAREISDRRWNNAPQLCHVSRLFAKWRVNNGRPFQAV